MSEIARMVRLGVVADGRVASAELSALARAAAGAGLGPIWVTDRSPTGPLSPDQLRVLTEACEAAGALWRETAITPVGRSAGTHPQG